ncbi:hypothetical protein M0R89_15235 [Halorussus limi]|uniref:Uncharacterized protein n=2 Tax=Halorussus TaxID=1070314 RepID=A0A8U0II10_9EURY|nr:MULTISPECIES: hypothetical protein [Halorussus]UPV73884.1 hypothetical protein M0R89_15235 [Halorussus limi]UPV99901.1 hypothetical protein M0R88_15450 [Halorussus gelatinilyticus]
MTDSHTELPEGWVEVPPAEQQESILFEYQYQTDTETTVLVSVLTHVSDAPLYKLRLSTITPRATVTRHDYPVAQYETKEKARTNAIAFLHHVSAALENGTLSQQAPDPETIQSLIADFSSDGLFPRFRSLSRKLL